MANDNLRGVRTVRVNRRDVLKRLQENRSTHETEYEEAMVGYKLAVIEELKNALRDAKNDTDYRTSFHLPEPQNHLQDYDNMLELLGMSLDIELELTDVEFSQYVLDDWSWKQQFTTTSAIYNAR